MRTATLAAIIAAEYEEQDAACLYLVRDGATVFYVGTTRDPISSRIGRHIDARSALGALIVDNTPESFQWQVDMFTLADCAEAVREFFPGTLRYEDRTAEHALILKYRPCLNTMHRGADFPNLPARYSTGDIERAKRRAARSLHVPYGEGK